MKKFLYGFFYKEWTIYEKALLTGLAVSIGVIAGFFLSPLKSGCLFQNTFLSNNNASDCGSRNVCKDDGLPGKTKKISKGKSKTE